MLVLCYSESELNSVWLVGFMSLFRKILEFFESLYQPSGPIGKTKLAGSFGSVCWNGSLCWFLVIRSRN